MMVNYYFNGSTARFYAVNAMIAQSNHTAIVQALLANLATTKTTLYNTEDLAHITNYLKHYHPIEVLQLNLYHDNLQAAFSGLVNYSPLDFAEELKADFTNYFLQFETLSNCSTDNTYLALASNEIYGSSRLGVVDAKNQKQR